MVAGTSVAGGVIKETGDWGCEEMKGWMRIFSGRGWGAVAASAGTQDCELYKYTTTTKQTIRRAH